VLSHAAATWHLASRICGANPVHLHVEESTRHNPVRIADNVLRARKEGAKPIVVLNRATGPATTQELGSLWYRLQTELGTHQQALTGLRCWVLTPSQDLLEYRPLLDDLTPLARMYARDRPESSAPKGP
jgi:hypothetical protein